MPGSETLTKALRDADDGATFIAEVRKQQARDTLSRITPTEFLDDIELPAGVQEWLDTPKRSLYLTGKVGVGKTHTAWQAIRGYLGLHPQTRVVYHRATSLLDTLRPGDDERKARALVRECQGTGLLFLDDLGAEKASEWTQERLYEVVDERYAWQRPMVITSNVPPKSLETQVGARVASRLAGACLVVPILGDDRRRA